LVSEGMNITEMAPELMGCLRTKLGQAAAAQPPKPLDAPISIAPLPPTDQVAPPGQSASTPVILEDTQND
jgi:hypothetical protein